MIKSGNKTELRELLSTLENNKINEDNSNNDVSSQINPRWRDVDLSLLSEVLTTALLPNNQTFLHIASTSGNAEIVEMLLDVGIDPALQLVFIHFNT